MLCFFFQAEAGIRDLTVTGVQTCALPISRHGRIGHQMQDAGAVGAVVVNGCHGLPIHGLFHSCPTTMGSTIYWPAAICFPAARRPYGALSNPDSVSPKGE